MQGQMGWECGDKVTLQTGILLLNWVWGLAYCVWDRNTLQTYQ